jgi:glycosyltransferase involved in cell wall biosynthesis
MDKKNILWIVDHLGYNGVLHGAGKYYLNTIPHIDKNKFNIQLVVLRKKDELTKLFTDEGINVTHLGRQKFDLFTITDLLSIIRKNKIQLIHTHGYGSDNFGRFAGQILGIQTIIHAHDDNSNYPWHQKISDVILKPFTKNGIAISNAVLESCVKKRKIKRNKLRVLHNGIHIEQFNKSNFQYVGSEKEKLGFSSDTKFIGTIARLREEKGIKYLIQAAPQILKVFDNIVFYIVGDGPQRNELENIAKEYKISDKIIFAGFKTNIPAELSLIDIFVAPSVTEGLGLGILEAMAMEKPIIASKVGGIREIIIDGKTGLFVPSQDSKSLAMKIIYLLNNEAIAAELAKNAYEESKSHDNDHHVESLKNIYNEILQK